MKHLRKKIIITISIIASLSFSQSIFAQFAGLPFSSMLSTYPQYSSIYYHFGGNNFVGMLFLSGSTAIPEGENISINGGSSSITCYYRINGVYYNNLRGWRIRPLDTGNLAKMLTYDSNYSSLAVGGGLYTNCTGNNAKPSEIYGQLTHTRGGISYSITAGIAMDTASNSTIQSGIFSGSLSINSGKVYGLLYDTYGGIGELGEVSVQTETGATVIVGMTQGNISAQCGGFHISAISGSDISLTCTGTNVNGYVVSLFESSGGNLTLSTGGFLSPFTNTFTIPEGNYIASCTANIGSSSCNPIAISNLSGDIYTSELGSGQVISTISMANAIAPIRNASIKTSYTSEPIIVNGLTAPTLATISKGYLSINGTGVGTTGYVKNGDIITIELISSKNYNTSLSSTLFVGGMFGTFEVITKDNTGEDCNLNNTEKYKIAQMFELLKDSYSSTTSKWLNMLYVLQSMTEDIQEFDYSCSLDYLTDLVETEIEDGGESDNEESVDETTHTAPNCKEYPIDYDEELDAYTSSKFKKEIYFISRELLVRFIDSQNPGDCHINVYTNEEFDFEDTDDTHVAPNGKIYTIETDDEGLYTSPTMSTSKKFDTLESLTEYIDKYNPEFPIWDHEVDEDTDPIVYAAPNGKEYTIYKTDQGYMSYRFLTVKYFDSLEEIKSFIDKNNK